MKVYELSSKIEAFRADLIKHADLWKGSLDPYLPEYPIENGPKLRVQTDALSRKLGQLRPYIDRFAFDSIMTLGGSDWDIFDCAVSNDTPIRKGHSIEAVLQQLQQMLGRMDSMIPGDEFTLDARPTPEVVPQQVTVYNLHGAQSRVNIQSTDRSTNVSSISEDELFAGIREALNNGVSDGLQLKEIVEKLADLEAARHTDNFLAKYQSFLTVAAAHITLIAPFLAALAQMIGN